jgi:hypothetical protein
MIAELLIGVHLHTFHVVPDGPAPVQRTTDSTPGLYVVGDGWTAGVVRNSFRRWSWYAGKVWRVGSFDLVLGGATGYQKETVTGKEACVPEYRMYGNRCQADVGVTNAKLMPLVALSYAHQIPALDARARVTLMVSGVHFSIERSF